MKTLKIPYIPALEAMLPSDLLLALHLRGAQDVVDNAPWSEFPEKPEVAISAAASNKYLFVSYRVRGRGLKAEFTDTNQPVWEDSCVEFFVADKDGNGYRNFEINCIGTLLSAHQEEKGKNTEHISEEDAIKIRRYTSLEPKPFEEKEGEYEWRVTVGIPWNLLGYDSMPDSIRANFYKCADGSRWPHYLCWSPIDTPQPDFHRPEFFGKLIFEK